MKTNLAYQLDDSDICACSNCAWIGVAADLEDIADIAERVAPGESVPAGECPNCGALAHPVEAYRELQALRENIANVQRYSDALDALEICPNGDDFNAIRDLIAGAPYNPPHKSGR